MRPTTIALTLLVLTAACETSTDPGLFGIGGGGGSAITAAQATGNWSFNVNHTANLPCTPGALQDGTRLTMNLNVGADGTVTSSTSSWQNSGTGTVFPLSGSVNLSNGLADLFMSGGSGTSTGMEMSGTISPTGSFSGTLNDPGGGFTPMFSGLGCQYAAAGTKA